MCVVVSSGNLSLEISARREPCMYVNTSSHMGCTTSTTAHSGSSPNPAVVPHTEMHTPAPPQKHVDTQDVSSSYKHTPPTQASQLDSARTATPSTGNVAMDPGMFIHQQRGTLVDRYTKEKKLGSGAYGEVSPTHPQSHCIRAHPRCVPPFTLTHAYSHTALFARTITHSIVCIHMLVLVAGMVV